MRCPLCRDTDLEPRFSRGIEVDVCPRCRGLWLDRGELERLLAEGDVPPAPPAVPTDAGRGHRDDRDDRHGPRDRKKRSKAKRLADLLDDVLDL